MSFSNLISGAECATSSNPLSQVLKHTEADHSLQRDRLGAPSLLQHLPRTQGPSINYSDAAAARQFFGPGPSHSPALASTPVYSIPTPPVMLSPNNSNAEFEMWLEKSRGGTPLEATRENHSSPWAQELNHFQPPTLHQQTHQAGPPLFVPHPQMASSFHPVFYETSLGALEKGKGKATDSQFENAFLEAEKAAASSSIFDSSELERTMDRLRLEHEEPKADDQYLSDFQRVWQDINGKPGDGSLEELARWEKELNEALSSQRDGLEQGFDFQSPSDIFSGLDSQFGLPNSEISIAREGTPNLGTYKFEENPHLDDSGSSLQKAKALLESGGSFGEIASLLEAAIQRNDLGEGGYEAWILLGEVRGMDESDELGILALREGVRIAQEQGGAGGVGLLSLAVAYTNEGYDKASQSSLLDWLKARYPEYSSSITLPSTFTQPWAVHDIVRDAFLNVARLQHSSDQEPDPELQTGLGVLFYINGEYDKAADCFASALSVRPDDYTLWNRYGSCLSNGNKPEESLAAYRQALALRPKYTRAVYNVGVACLNLNANKEAAEHFLTGLKMQGGDGDGKSMDSKRSEQLWSTLRRTFIAMDRADLADKSKDGNLEFFRTAGFDF